MTLNQRQIAILEKIGIDVWCQRDADSSMDESEAVFEAAPGESSVAQCAVNGGITLEQIAETIASCQKCQLHSTRINTVPGIGNLNADWMFVGEAPGQNEDQQGLPFVGRAGQLLDAMIAALNMKREDVFIANVVKCRPPNNRDPLYEEVDQCEPYLHQQLELIRPKIIVALGRVSAQALLKTDAPIGKLRGQIYQYGSDKIPLIPTYHPAYLLRSPQQKAKAWEDLLVAKSLVDEQNEY